MQKGFKKHKMFLTKKNLTIILFFICLVLILSSYNPVSTIRAVSTRAPNKFPPYIWNGSVTPQSGNTSTIFTFQVSYHDTDNNAPVTQDVQIDNFPYVMTLVSGTYTTEAIYQFQTTLWGGNHTSYFYFSDGKWTVKLPASGYYYWPNVTGPPGGWGPQLYQGNVTPQSGSPTTVFTYQVTYYDYFGVPPINKYVYIDGFPFTMTYVSGSYNQGALYQYQTTLGIGNHTYYFNFNNSYGNVNLPYYGCYYGPAVTFSGGVLPNTPPTLSNGFVTPQLGNPSTTFTYQVTYTDIDNNPPVLTNVNIDGTGYAMNYVTGTPSQGVIYQYKTTLNLGSNHNYYFQFADWNASVRLPTDGVYTAPLVTESPPDNNPPLLSSGSVTPNSGNTDTLFTFQVTYQDQDGYPPTLRYIYLDSIPYLMTHINGIYTTGAIYQYQTTLLIGIHNYYFYFSDGQAYSRSPTQGSFQGPTVQPGGPPPNNPPTLNNGTVTPQSGQITTIFSYQVKYQDPDGDSPVIKDVYIDTMAYPMNFISGSNKTGAIYQYKTTLPGGNHTYNYLFSDGKTIAKLPASGIYSGPSVKIPAGPNKAPILFNGSVTPQSGNASILYTYQVTYKDQDNDTPIIKSVFIDNQGFQMIFIKGNNTAGAIYQYKTNLVAGNHTYYFYFNDGVISTRLPVNGSYSAPNVTGAGPNKKPILFSGTVYPNAGTAGTVFTYQLIYKDMDNDPPNFKNVYIDGISHVMYLKYGLFTAGAIFEYKITLSEGVHNYHFNFSDGKAFARLPISGNYLGPTVTKTNIPPVANAGLDQTIEVGPPHTVYFNGSSSYDSNNDTLLFYWDFMDGDYDVGMNVSHIFHGVGDYNVSLIIWDGFYVDQDYCIIHVIDSGQGKTKGKAPEKDPTPGFESLTLVLAMVIIVVILNLKKRRLK